MKVLVFSGYANYTHYGADLELIQRHLDEGDEVLNLHCAGDIPTCDFNPCHGAIECRTCIRTRQRGLSLVSPNVASAPFLNLTPANRRELESLPESYGTLESLRTASVENFDFGWAVLSSVVSLIRDPEPDLRLHGNLARRFAWAALATYRSIQNHLDREKTDCVYVFNGRLAIYRAVLRACQSRGVACYTHDRGCDIHHYATFRDAMPHDLQLVRAEMRQAWDRAAGDPARFDVAEKFFVERMNGMPQDWLSFVGTQEAGMLPASWEGSRKNIVIFNSSEDEFAAIGDEWKNPLYPSQLDGIRRIIESLTTERQGLKLYLRMHPNLKGIGNQQTTALYDLERDYFEVIRPESAVSTYALLQQCDQTVTFGSTVGIEAVYQGKPSILAGPSFYRDLGCTYNPSSHEELVQMIRSDLQPKDKTPALMYGYFMRTFGIPYRHVSAAGFLDSRFKGQSLATKMPFADAWLLRVQRLQKALKDEPVSNWPTLFQARFNAWMRKRAAAGHNAHAEYISPG